ncbi:hypothetical protein H072_7400 [Dactylellina haptotyla CBS 200.50]|uniref:Uncharacterized protein n=1 Tax=Dactylellina haptotyla (strain CBS 200.50) TaxID=1284197 RepID=S8BU85_DACHA|nr:hypothetical protein H072_7400 [Dactylellina haptotyla CBS 200.50]
MESTLPESPGPVETAVALKNTTISNLHKYHQYQSVAASRGLPGVTTDCPDTSALTWLTRWFTRQRRTDTPVDDEIKNADDEELLAQLHKIQASLEVCFEQLETLLKQMETSLLATRAKIWLGAIVCAVFIIALGTLINT